MAQAEAEALDSRNCKLFFLPIVRVYLHVSMLMARVEPVEAQ